MLLCKIAGNIVVIVQLFKVYVLRNFSGSLLCSYITALCILKVC